MLSLAVPGLAYSGLIMTEVAFYPIVVLAAWACARALARRSASAQLLAVAALVVAAATRLQAAALVPAYATALLVIVIAERDPRLIRRFWPSALALAAVAAGWAAWRLSSGGPGSEVFGAYRAAGEVSYSFGDAVLYTRWHAADLILMTAGVPACALALELVLVLRGRERSAQARSTIAVAAAFSGWFVVEVGVFASRHVGRLAERDLLSLAPLAFLAFCLWLDRGAPRPRIATWLVGAGALVLVASLPIQRLVSLAAAPDAFTLIPLYRLEVRAPGLPLRAVVIVLAVIAVAAFLFVRPRARLPLAAAVALVLAGASLSATRVVSAQARVVESVNTGDDPRWLDGTADGPVSYVYAGEAQWTAVWANRFWNARLIRVYDLLSARVPGPIPQSSIGPLEDGRLVLVDGRPAPAVYIVASDTLTFAGTVVRRAPTAGLELWRLAQPVRLREWLQTNTVLGRIEFRAYDCHGGTLRLTLRLEDGATISRVVRAHAQRPGSAVCVADLTAPPRFSVLSRQFVRSAR